MAEKVDLFVVGTGGAARAAIVRCRRAGWSVAVADYQPYGGTSELRGCLPKVILTEVGRQVQHCRRLAEARVIDHPPRLLWERLIEFKRALIRDVPRDTEALFVSLGVQTLHGKARFVAPGRLAVNGREFEAGFTLIASGAYPRPLRIVGEELVLTSDGFLELDHLPPRVVFIGGGYISMEFAHVAARAGAKVTVLERGPRLLRQFDKPLTDTLREASREAGVEILTKVDVTGVRREGAEFAVTGLQAGQAIEVRGDLVVHGAGRVPNLDALDCKAGGVLRKGALSGVCVNEFMQSVSDPTVYAAGDCNDSPGLQLEPIACIEGDAAALNMLGGNHRRVEYEGIPTVVFTSPRLAFVGLTEEQAASRGLAYDIIRRDMASWPSNRRLNLKYSGSAVLVDRHQGRIVGASLLGPNSEEVINLFGLAIRNKLPVAALEDMPFAFPTDASNIKDMV
ncbi:MAG: NAD(P)/FAD-dependent oxidoreductase [Phycisphaerae bacterium]|nr:NAD(P)/FAD-dependent oxidoreductase [Phycisphaerae bacterium]